MNAIAQTETEAGVAPLSASGVSQYYDGQQVLDRVDLALQPGSVLGLIGRNGAGKSTLIRALLGLIEPAAGSAFVFGEAALELSDSAKERLAYVPQEPDALAWLSSAQMFDYLSRFYPRWDHAFAKQSLERWHIPPRKLLAKLSPGERQRVELIRALAPRPGLLVLDEPASALDPLARRDLLREIALRAGDAGTSVLFSSHIVSDLERVASAVALLHQGRLKLHCAMDEVREHHARLWLPPAIACAAPDSALARHSRDDGSLSLIVSRDDSGAWPEAARLPGARLDPLGLEDLFVEIAE